MDKENFVARQYGYCLEPLANINEQLGKDNSPSEEDKCLLKITNTLFKSIPSDLSISSINQLMQQIAEIKCSVNNITHTISDFVSDSHHDIGMQAPSSTLFSKQKSKASTTTLTNYSHISKLNIALKRLQQLKSTTTIYDRNRLNNSALFNTFLSSSANKDPNAIMDLIRCDGLLGLKHIGYQDEHEASEAISEQLCNPIDISKTINNIQEHLISYEKLPEKHAALFADYICHHPLQNYATPALTVINEAFGDEGGNTLESVAYKPNAPRKIQHLGYRVVSESILTGYISKPFYALGRMPSTILYSDEENPLFELSCEFELSMRKGAKGEPDYVALQYSSLQITTYYRDIHFDRTKLMKLDEEVSAQPDDAFENAPQKV